MYLLILESIGMPELILIGIVALIIFGPRKLPQMAKTMGKTMADFRRATNEFKETWEREASVLEELKIDENDLNPEHSLGNTISRKSLAGETEKDNLMPEIREIEVEKIKENLAPESAETEIKTSENPEVRKQDWL